jgi:hypothetical protein
MSISRVAAREITTGAEQQLVDDSFHPRVRQLSESELRRALTRARRLRDKYSDLARRQGLVTKRRGRSGSRDNTRTNQKAQLFAETIERLEKRITAVADRHEPA